MLNRENVQKKIQLSNELTLQKRIIEDLFTFINRSLIFILVIMLFDSWQKVQKAISTRVSRAVPHLSTNLALIRLTSEFGWDPVHLD